ncbi:MAG TPA: hypothetical protein VF142_22000 [Longimicrobium sp.]
MPEPIILLRLFVEVDSRAEAEAEVPRITSRLERFGAVETRKVEQYYKIEEYWEIALDLHPAGAPLEAYEGLIGMAAAGWKIGEVVDEQEDRWAVWNAEPGVEFLTPRVAWASVDLLPFGINHADDDVEYLDVDAPIR